MRRLTTAWPAITGLTYWPDYQPLTPTKISHNLTTVAFHGSPGFLCIIRSMLVSLSSQIHGVPSRLLESTQDSGGYASYRIHRRLRYIMFQRRIIIDHHKFWSIVFDGKIPAQIPVHRKNSGSFIEYRIIGKIPAQIPAHWKNSGSFIKFWIIEKIPAPFSSSGLLENLGSSMSSGSSKILAPL